ncbi:hypothetical protein AURDEDRAFT_185381 [Auricularia subglabra TFB-10046 SS5]|nr:hypothetical protein AURDEDRAFT_185381 [Auricularia subglabra TFB-10046 SS5]
MLDSNSSSGGTDYLACQTIRWLVDRLHAVTREANERCKVNQLPTELFLSVGSFLSPRDLCKAAVICRSWRATLLGTPQLWTRICLDLRTEGPSAWLLAEPLFRTLFSRSQQLPVNIELRCFDVSRSVHEGIAGIIVDEMPRVQSLLLVFPGLWSTTKIYFVHPLRYWFDAESNQHLPTDLFHCAAPRLVRLSLIEIIPDNFLPLPSVTVLVYDPALIEDEDLEVIERCFPALRSLTLVATKSSIRTPAPRCMQPLALRLPNLYNISDFISAFPNATTMCLSYSPDESPCHDIPTLLASITQLTSMAISETHDDSPVVSVELNGITVAVDLSIGQALVAVDTLSDRFHGLRSISAPAILWDSISRHALPPLDQVRLYLRVPDPFDKQRRARRLVSPIPRPVTATSISLLRLVAPPDYGTVGPPEAAVMETIRTICDAAALQTLVICGEFHRLRPLEDWKMLRSELPHIPMILRMPDNSPVCASGLEDAVRTSIKALWQSSISRPEASYVDVHQKLHLLVNDTLRSLGENENSRRMVNQLPTELFIHVASFLPLQDVWRAALVCRGWRARLLGFPRLWTRICVSQRSRAARWSTRSSAILRTFFARSQDLPLSVEFRSLEDDDEDDSDLDEYDNVADLIAEEMHRVRSLSLVLPDVNRTSFEGVITQPAPILACFRLYVEHDSEYVPEFLFDELAPCLTSLTLSKVDFYPSVGCVAVQAVNNFTHNARNIMHDDVNAICLLLPALRSLTLFGADCDSEPWTAICPQPLALRLPCMDDVTSLINVFPNATSVCLSSSTVFSQYAFTTFIGTWGHPTSIEVGYRPTQLIDPHFPYRHAHSGIILKLNGADVAVDLDTDEAGIALDLLSERLERVHSITVDENLWPLFGPQLVLSSLRELTVH